MKNSRKSMNAWLNYDNRKKTNKFNLKINEHKNLFFRHKINNMTSGNDTFIIS